MTCPKESVRRHLRNTKRLLLPAFLILAMATGIVPFLPTILILLLGAATVVVGIAVKPLVSMGFPVGFLAEVKRIAQQAAQSSQYFADYEEPRFWVMETAKEGVRCWVAAWADTPTDAWFLKADIRSELITKLSALGFKPHQYNLVHHSPETFVVGSS